MIIPVGVTPDPVPISEVKPFWADGTAGFACGRVSCRQDRVDKIKIKGHPACVGLILQYNFALIGRLNLVDGLFLYQIL